VTDNAGASATANVAVTKSGHGLFQPGGGLFVRPRLAATKPHLQRTARAAALSAMLRRVLGLELALRA